MEIPEDVLLYHGSKNRLSKWMYSRGLFSLASKIKKANQSHFKTIDDLRKYIVQAIIDYRILLGHGVVARLTLRLTASISGLPGLEKVLLEAKQGGLLLLITCWKSTISCKNIPELKF
jgi:hypothetical protein